MNRLMPALAAAIALSAPSVHAAEHDGWEHTLLIYLLGPNIDGTTGIGPVSVEVDAGISDVFSNLEYGALASYGAEKGDWGVILEMVYMALGADGERPGGIISADVDFDQLMLNGYAARRVGEHTQFLFGARFVDISGDVSVTGPLQTRRGELEENWTVPVVGLRWAGPLSEKWSYGLLVDAGFTNLDDNSTWQISGALHYAVSEAWDLTFGYRYLDFDHVEGSGADRFEFNLAQHGPALGARWKF